MKKSRFSDDQLIGILREQEAGRPTAEVRDGCLNETLFTSLDHARAVLAAWHSD